ncbi:hypothetical protein AbraIFM66951_010710 [Aspergillus brasiliensis]|uniref:FAD-binding domain-containing protein n=1 Tax=Aspergillus brasiliensis TaxID=319629 RepID=A0A9W6DR64_9EURO|nr:hypothetical protein AbraCBS73388_011305 [Aspergillus brasiliensis]GKZ47350.1 hypothetical protein AbraIFM66951_010710 [Aspergillus brasiliensis]
MKIVIIGAGISGCAAYLTLRKHLPPPPSSSPTQDHEYTIYEAHPTSSSNPTIGGALGIAPNGLRVLERLDSDLLRDAVRGGYMVDHGNLKDKHGRVLMRLPCSSSITTTRGGSDKGKEIHLLGTSRHSIWQCLRARVPDEIIINKRVASVRAHATERNVVTFVDGSEPVEADLVIGADGLWSVVRKALFDGEDAYPPHYEGLIGIGGFLPTPSNSDIPLPEAGSMNFLFSGSGFFGYFYSNTSSSTSLDGFDTSAYNISSSPGDTIAWWTTYSPPHTSTPPKNHDINIDMNDMLAQLHTRYTTWTDPLVHHILNSIQVESIYPTWTTPPLPTWSKEGIVLVGDAAHALPTTSGQGASQALEDAEVLARLVAHEVGIIYQQQMSGGMVSGIDIVSRVGEKQALQMACKKYMGMRMPRVQRILDRARTVQGSKKDSRFGWVGEWVMYWGMWILG